MGDANRRAAPQFRRVGDQHHAARIGNDGLGRLHLAIVEIEQRALLVDRGGADDGVIDLELADQADGGRSDHGAVGTSHRPARHDHLDARMPVKQHRDIEVVGDDEQILMRGQRACHLLRGGADVDEQRAAIGNLRRRGRADRLLLFRRDEPARFVSEVLDAGGNDGAPMNPRQRPLIAQVVQILADGLRRDLEPPGEVFHHHPAEGAGEVEDFVLAVAKAGHGAPRTEGASWCGGSGIRSTRQIGFKGRSPLEGRITVKGAGPHAKISAGGLQ